MARESPPAVRASRRAPGEPVLIGALVLLTLLLRLPFVSRFDLVSFDGTYYITQSKALLHGSLSGGAFPIGYPLLIAPVLALVRDGVLAAALVSLLAGIGSVWVLYALARRYVTWPYAFAAGLLLAAAPIFIDASLATLSESAYGFWVLLSLWYFDAQRMMRSGLAIGMAAATRPEALAVAAGLAVWRRRTPRALVSFALAFVLVYGVSVAALSVPQGRLTLLSRAGAYKSLATVWSLREQSVPYEGKAAVERRAQSRAEPLQRGRSYMQRLPREFVRLGRHALPALPGLALLVLVYRRSRRDASTPPAAPWFVVAALAPLPLIPLFTEERGIVRWLVPYVAPMILFAVCGLARAPRGRMRHAAVALTVVCALVSLAVNQRAIGHEIETDMRTNRDVARRFAARVDPGDAIADRKPYFAFYAGARYVEIPVAPYDNALAHLDTANVRFLAINPKSANVFRPAMRPLMFDRAAIRGEFRYRQIQFEPTGEIVYERRDAANPLSRRSLTTPEMADHSPAWSPNGRMIAFRRDLNGGAGAIALLDPGDGKVRELVRADPVFDAIAWSPDGAQIAYMSFAAGRMVLNTCDISTGRSVRITAENYQQWNPSWCRRTGDLVLCSNEGRIPAVFVTRIGSSKREKVSLEEPADLASISPSGAWISWVDPAGHLVLLEVATGESKKVRDPVEILSASSWSPDGSEVLVEAFDWGSSNVYMIDVRSGRSLRVTCIHNGVGMPAWGPDGDSMVAVAGHNGKPALWMYSHLQPYVARLAKAEDVMAFERPANTRTPAPAGARRFRAAK